MFIMQIGSAIAQKGEISLGSIPIAEICDSTSIEVPIIIIQGVKKGKCLWVQNGVHGDELTGLGAIHKLIDWINLGELAGTLVMVPMLNIMAYRAGERMAPQDGVDMNRIWPGAPMKKAMHLWAHSELVVDAVVRHMRENADVVIDAHDAGLMGQMSPYAAYYTGNGDMAETVKRLAYISGMNLIWETQASWVSEKVPGSLKTEMGKNGIPSITLEVGGENKLIEEDVECMFRAFKNIMKHLNMLDGELELPDNQFFITKGNWLRATRGGLLWQYCRRLDQVKKGDLLAVTRDIYGKVIEEFYSPVDGICIGFRTLGTVQTGMYVVNIGSR